MSVRLMGSPYQVFQRTGAGDAERRTPYAGGAGRIYCYDFIIVYKMLLGSSPDSGGPCAVHSVSRSIYYNTKTWTPLFVESIRENFSYKTFVILFFKLQ